MTDTDRKLRRQFREESDEMLFSNIEMSEDLKAKVRRTAAAEKPVRRTAFPKSWMLGAAALAAAVMLLIGYPMLQPPAAPTPGDQSAGSEPPANGGAVGSDLSQLITTPLSTVDEAATAFGAELHVPNDVPEGFTLSEIAAVGMEGEPARDVIFTYASGEKSLTFVASRLPAAFPADLFSKTTVGGADGFVFEQPGLTELFWSVDGIQYSVTGQITGEEALQVAESAQ
ncbi:hypothetical protein FE782_10355 [Paenibacillus antri]|uniref:DUF4367 domain-containing protein n=1 Tax=Paenibacillus antri TaxID=2582848 RepID=A0A5R9GKU1_9BACL|nr:hypothetical protein [Paenibacillus antri]TLS52365.1 hypothetical protein FE782_10355 [Paenibacillus antri]